MLGQFIAAFLASGSFAVMYNVPGNVLFNAGLTGAVGWVITWVLSNQTGIVVATAFGAFAVAFLSEVWARRYRHPVTLTLIPGLIPLVPGMWVYNTMLSFLQGNTSLGVEQLVTTCFIGGAIAGGIIFVSSLFRIKKHKRSSRTFVKKG